MITKIKTHLFVFFSANGIKPSKIVDKLEKLELKPVIGASNFVYDWTKKPTMKDIFEFSDEIHKALKGTKVLFDIETK